MRARARVTCATLALAACCSISTATYGASGSVIYTYDSLGRVATANYDTGVIVIYSYDANGNRTQRVVNLSTQTLIWSSAGTCPSQACWNGGVW